MDRPILFSAPMVRALLEGRKTQTRRVIKPKGRVSLFDGQWSDSYVLDPGNQSWRDQDVPTKPGDRLWVREAWARSNQHEWLVAYRADGECGAWQWDGDGKPLFNSHGKVLDCERRDGLGQWGIGKFGGRWRSSIHLPRKYSRLTLTVTDVRVQRLQDISEEDARAEGAPDFAAALGADGVYPATGETNREISDRLTWCKRWYSHLWDEINGAGSWDANPWVAAYTFTVERRNIDEGLGQRADATPNPSPAQEG